MVIYSIKEHNIFTVLYRYYWPT